MRIIPPKSITDAALVSSNVTEADHAAYNSATTYTAGQQVIVTTPNVHRIYTALKNTTGEYPPNNSSTTLSAWQDDGATNRWKMFDDYVNTVTTNADSIVVELDASRCDSVVLFGLVASTVELTLTVGATVMHNETVSMSQNESASWSDYFFNPFAEGSDLSRTIPLYGSGSVLKIEVNRPGGTAELGHCVIGRAIDLGRTVYNPKSGIIDYSRKDTNPAGYTYLKQDVYKDTLQAEMRVDNGRVDYVRKQLVNYRAAPAVWDFNNVGGTFNSLIVFGFYKEFALVIPGPSQSSFSLEIEGLI